MPGVRLNFLPQMADMHVQAVLVPVIVRAPDGLANGIIGYDVPAVIGQPLQQALGMVQSLLRLAKLDWPVPDFSTVCLRQKTLRVELSYQ